MPPKRQQRSYTFRERQEALELLETSSIAEVYVMSGVPKRTLRGWMADRDSITTMEHTGNLKAKTRGGQGRKEIIPFAHGLILFMKDVRRSEQVLSTPRMIVYIKKRTIATGSRHTWSHTKYQANRTIHTTVL